MASKLINSRSETVTEKTSFRSSAAKRRAIIPANGYYEWMKSEEGKKIPYFLHGEGDLNVMAGLYELWPDPELPEGDPNKWVWTCAVLARPVIYPSDGIVVTLVSERSARRHWPISAP